MYIVRWQDVCSGILIYESKLLQIKPLFYELKVSKNHS